MSSIISARSGFVLHSSKGAIVESSQIISDERRTFAASLRYFTLASFPASVALSLPFVFSTRSLVRLYQHGFPASLSLASPPNALHSPPRNPPARAPLIHSASRTRHDGRAYQQEDAYDHPRRAR